MSFSKSLFVGILALTVGATAAWWLTNYSGAGRANKRPAAKNLEEFREQFRHPDGTPPSDDELRQMLQAKGIAYSEKCTPGQDCPAAQPAFRAAIPDIEFASAIAVEQREKLRSAITEVVSHQLAAMRQHQPELRLERVVVDSGMKLQLYFNAEFASIADDESKLRDFSESLHVLGMSGLRGSAFFIGGKPLGLYLQKKDAERDRAAREQSPQIEGESRR